MSGLGGSMGDGPRLGAMFGRYRIEAVVGRGGMGVVLRATDTQLGRPVALKLLAIDPTTELLGGHGFLDEARLAASLDHPAIVPIHEAGVIDGTPFIAMRLVPGTDLARLLRSEAPLSLAATLRIVAPVAAALDTAHAHALVHGDVKPGNILVESAADGRVFLADFGLTRRFGGSTGAVGGSGTLEYMAPEQLSGEPVDGRADQYALGCVVAHCLLGRPSFDGETDAQIIEAHLAGGIPSIEATIPGGFTGLDVVVSRALARRPSDRFPDCGAFIAALRALDARTAEADADPVAGSVTPPSAPPSAPPVQPAPQPPAVATARQVRPRTVAVAGAIAALAAVVIIALAVGPLGLLRGRAGPSADPLPSGVTSAQREWERTWIARTEQAAVDAGWQRCPSRDIKGRVRDCPARSLDCIPLREGLQFEKGGATAAILCRFSLDQAVLNGFLFAFADADARDAWYAQDVLYTGEGGDAAQGCASDGSGEGSWVEGAATGRVACWRRPEADGVIPFWWLSWYVEDTTRLGLLVSQPLDAGASVAGADMLDDLVAAWRALPQPLGLGTGVSDS